MSTNTAFSGPLAGDPLPLHGGSPSISGCGGCTDCCHLPEISVTDEEAARLQAIHPSFPEPLGELVIDTDPAHEGWAIMRGPCVFRRLDRPLVAGGCRIYEDRPAGCEIFTCRLLLDLRRAQPIG
jgi:Fe-S-cluster containining protein